MRKGEGGSGPGLHPQVPTDTAVLGQLAGDLGALNILASVDLTTGPEGIF